MSDENIRTFVTARILSRISGAGARRDEALRAVLGIASPGLDDAALDRLVAEAPEIPVKLYEKWIDLFLDRLIETIPREQMDDLCRNTPESNASLLLVYSMFMESEKMEKIVADDLEFFLKDLLPSHGGN